MRNIQEESGDDSEQESVEQQRNHKGESSGSANEGENGPSEDMLEGAEVASYLSMTEIQVKSIAPLLEYDPPDGPKEYVHRVGRTARGKDGRGNALLILQIANIQTQLENLMSNNYYLNKSAKEAYKSYIRTYDSHSLKVCKAFGFTVPPFVDLPISHKPKVEIRSKLSRAGYRKKQKPFGFKQKKPHH
ncbi:hypothetical protein WR25_17425 [Diploscapter pachys]|uniref:ATP-dependent rRNA helicase SPB4-like C-terminal extension domain-containing protein n=1 Tax=Diploscapter pachys TaxID=2018661 RepID=A0A2A2JVQ7_9BILA|nr:hypothetical protein WR25_17425 [Diploscapter pachys]